MVEAPLELSLVLAPTDDRTVDDLSTAFYGHFDGLLSERLGQTFALIRRPGNDRLSTAVEIILELESTLGILVTKVDWDIVDITEIAHRMDVTPSNVHQLVTGRRSDGSFPQPLGLPSGHRVWSWPAVNEWIRSQRPGSWSGFRTLTENEMRWLDGWLVQRDQHPESRSRISHRPEVTALTSEFLRVQWVQVSPVASTAAFGSGVVVEAVS